MLLVRSLSDSIAVIITCHQYEHFLPEAVDSVLLQNVMPNEIIIVDDKPDQSPTKCQQVLKQHQWPNIKYLRTDFGNPLKAREAGFQASSSKYLCFLDADDHLGEGYLQRGLDRLTSTNASVIYSDIEYFGAEERKTAFPNDIPPSRVSIVNFMHVGCLVTRDAILSADAFNHPPLTEYQEDWMFWRKILHIGHHVAKQDGRYRARVHDQNRSKDLLATIGYYGLRGIEAATITLAGLCEYEHDGVNQLFVTKQNWPFNQIHLTLYNPKEHHSAPCDYSIVSSTDRINHAARTADTDYIFYYNESLEYPSDICKKLLQNMNVNIAGVHNTAYDLFDCTMVVTAIMQEHVCDGNHLKFRKGEQVIYIS